MVTLCAFVILSIKLEFFVIYFQLRSVGATYFMASSVSMGTADGDVATKGIKLSLFCSSN